MINMKFLMSIKCSQDATLNTARHRKLKVSTMLLNRQQNVFTSF